jgi:hypothetical protein
MNRMATPIVLVAAATLAATACSSMGDPWHRPGYAYGTGYYNNGRPDGYSSAGDATHPSDKQEGNQTPGIPGPTP